MSSEKSSVGWTKFIPLGSRIASVVNAGHVEWVTNNNAQAIEYYNKAKEICGDKKLADTLINDKEILFNRGVSKIELQLLIDLIS